MNKRTALMSLKKTSALLQAAVIASAALLPAMLLNGSASAGIITERFIDMSATQTSEGSGRNSSTTAGEDVTYSVSFDVVNTGDANIGGVVIDFCETGPLIGTACGNLPTNFNFATNAGSGLVIANQAGIVDFSIDAGNSDGDTVVLTRTAASVTAGTTVSFDLGSTGAADGFTNPDDNISFYARILTYTTSAAAQAYTSTVPGAYTDEGGIALATANELTVTARVQEVLQFCVGTTDATTNSDCTDISGTDIDLGVVDTTVTSSAADAGLAMIRTNASQGAVIYYKAEQDTSSGKLKQVGGACSGVSLADPCFNSAGATQSAFSANNENFGMTLTNIDTSNGGATTNLACDAEYDGDGSCGGGAATGYAWVDDGSFDEIATSVDVSNLAIDQVIDDEMVNIQFAAVAAPTTPTGLYSVTANFVATATF